QSESDHTVSGSSPVRVDVTWKNNTSLELRNVTLRANLEGNLYNPDSVSVSRGQFRSDLGSILWNSDTDPRLSEVDPNESGTVSFEFTPRLEGSSDPTMTITAEFSGTPATGNAIKVSRSTNLSVSSSINAR